MGEQQAPGRQDTRKAYWTQPVPRNKESAADNIWCGVCPPYFELERHLTQIISISEEGIKELKALDGVVVRENED
ncbi:hypothetical protein FVEN_g12841 [Fusarium venenatum]|nr:hypothetical protein FVEN_g12841 [Fusarium venenatum]